MEGAVGDVLERPVELCVTQAGTLTGELPGNVGRASHLPGYVLKGQVQSNTMS